MPGALLTLGALTAVALAGLSVRRFARPAGAAVDALLEHEEEAAWRALPEPCKPFVAPPPVRLPEPHDTPLL